MPTTRPQNTPARDAAWGRYYARHGLCAITARHFPALSNHVRIALYQMRRAQQFDTSRFTSA